jgi:hypothetical protein
MQEFVNIGIQHRYNDGGREQAGYKGTTGDCVTRAIAIATGKPYKEVYELVNGFAKNKGNYGISGHTTNARTGVQKKDTKAIMQALGFTWVPLMSRGTGCTTHLRSDELPNGIIICKLSKHVATVIDGVLLDTYDCSRYGTRCVYGYWRVS